MPTIFYTEAKDPEALRLEIVADLEARATAAERPKGGGKKPQSNPVAEALRAAAEHWRGALIGNPLAPSRPAQTVQAPTPQVSGGKHS